MAATVEIYTWRACPFCVRAKALLDRKGVTYTEYAIDGDEAARRVGLARGALDALYTALPPGMTLAGIRERRAGRGGECPLSPAETRGALLLTALDRVLDRYFRPPEGRVINRGAATGD